MSSWRSTSASVVGRSKWTCSALITTKRLGIAVLLDAMLVRLVLVPTLLRVFGHSAWALPRWLERILPRVSFGHG
jgi:hypothetical protein